MCVGVCLCRWVSVCVCVGVCVCRCVCVCIFLRSSSGNYEVRDTVESWRWLRSDACFLTHSIRLYYCNCIRIALFEAAVKGTTIGSNGLLINSLTSTYGIGHIVRGIYETVHWSICCEQCQMRHPIAYIAETVEGDVSSFSDKAPSSYNVYSMISLIKILTITMQCIWYMRYTNNIRIRVNDF